jgi:diguanylate cyclase
MAVSAASGKVDEAPVARILVVDDNPINRRLVATMLRHEGYQTVEAVDGVDALAGARASRPDLVISDILMPSMDGYEFARLLRADHALSDVPVIFYTAYYHEEQARTLAQSCHVARVLVKPCPAAQFLQAVAETLSGSKAVSAEPVSAEFDREHLRLVTDMLAKQASDLRIVNARLAALTELNVQLASERDPRVLLEKVCHGARSLLGASFAVLAATGRMENDEAINCASGVDGRPEQLTAPELYQGSLGQVARERRVLRLSSLDGQPVQDILPEGYPAVHNLLATPIMSITQTFGWLCLADKVGSEEFNAEDERILSILGAQAGRIYENGSLYREIQHHAAQLQIEMDERELATASLRESEGRFRQFAESIQDVFFMLSGDLRSTLYVSPAYEQIWGRTLQVSRLPAPPWHRGVYRDDRRRILQDLGPQGEALQRRCEFEFRIRRPDGETRWIAARTFPVADDRGQLLRVVGIATDITERKHASARIEHLNRVHAMLSGINSLIVRVQDRNELFREACRLAVEHGRFRIAWCGELDARSGEIRLTAWAGESSDLTTRPQPPMTADPREDSFAASALRAQTPMVCNDLQSETRRILFREELLARGYRGLVALPLIIESKAVGCLVLITDEKDFFNDAEMRLLTELSGDIAFAMDHLEKADRINYLALYDPLTGVANRTLFDERLAQYVNSAQRDDRTFALLIADPERFDAINESFGRHVGDDLLRQLAARLADCVGDVALIARLGSDQFAALLVDVRDSTDVVIRVGQWWRQWLGAPFLVEGKELRLTAKAGISLFPNDGTDAVTLLKNAESALKTAKNTGDNFQFYTEQLRARASEALALENELRLALEREEFVLHYQPKVDLETRRLEGVEALIRWNSPTRGLVGPLQFIPLLEETGLIVEAGAWALRQACEDRSRWLQAGLHAPRVAVNVSTIQLQRADFVRVVANKLRMAGGDAGLDIEVTESVIMHDAVENIAKLNELRELGIHIAIDDFGTGYSSLGYLTRLPASTLKIDRSFVSAMLDDPGAMTLVSTIISLARSLDLTVVAEGVELEEQAKILRLLRCNQMQGYLISRPLSFDDMTAYLARTRN